MQSFILADSFLSNFLANLFATLLGVVFGIPIALWMERKRQLKTEAVQEKDKQKRVAKILGLIREELQFNAIQLEKFHRQIEYFYRPLKDESWQAFSDGGELQWVDDPKLLSDISSTYFEIHQMILLYEKYYDSAFHPQMNVYQNLKDQMYAQLYNQMDTTGKKIKLTIEDVNKKLAEFENKQKI